MSSRLDGTLALLGFLGRVAVDDPDLLVGRERLVSGGSGGVPATGQLLQLCAEHGITAQVEVVPASRVGEALRRLERGDVRYRSVVDTAELSRP